MSERTLRPGNVAAGTAVLAGGLMVAIPQHALSIVQVAIVALGAAAALYALAANVPDGGWISPFKWGSPFGEAVGRPRGARHEGAAELDLIPWRMSGLRQRLDGAPPLPPKTIRLLQPLIREALELDADEAPGSATRGRTTPLTWAVLTAEPVEESRWRRWLAMRPPNRGEVAEVVHRILDDLDRLARPDRPPAEPLPRADLRSSSPEFP